MRAPRILAGSIAATAAAFVLAQQTPPPPPAFAAPNLSPKGVEGMAANCTMCHGTGGRAAQGSTVASLAGKPKDEIVQAMAQFKSGQKPATIMHQIAKGYGDAEVAALAEHFSRLPR
jgi:cytochrome c553